MSLPVSTLHKSHWLHWIAGRNLLMNSTPSMNVYGTWGYCIHSSVPWIKKQWFSLCSRAFQSSSTDPDPLPLFMSCTLTVTHHIFTEQVSINNILLQVFNTSYFTAQVSINNILLRFKMMGPHYTQTLYNIIYTMKKGRVFITDSSL